MRHLILIFLFLFTTPAIAQEGAAAPSYVAKASSTPMEQVGSGKYRKLGFNIYEATLWAPNGEYNKSEPFALQVHYLRELSKETVVDAVVEDVRKQQLADNATIDEWQEILADALPAVKAGDDIVGVSIPGKPAQLYYNGKLLASIDDKRLSDSFFNIWLGNVADPKLKAQLIAAKY